MNQNPSLLCLACGSAQKSNSVSVPDYEYRVPFKAVYVSCATCKTAYQVPMPSLETLASFYPNNYHSQTNQNLLHSIRNRIRFNHLKPWIQKEGAILDYGCGNGAFLMEASARMPNCRFFGYEIGIKRQIKKLNGGSVTIIEGSFENLLENLPACRLITMNHVLEHLPDPNQVISKLYEKLLPGGVLEGQTPAAGSLEQKIFKSRWSGYHAPRHTVIFSPKGLEQFLKKIGFEKVKNSPAFNPASLAVSLAAVSSKPDSHDKIRREGMEWLFWLGVAVVLAPVDLFSQTPAVMNFVAQKKGSQ